MSNITGKAMENGYVAFLQDGTRAVFDEISGSIYRLEKGSWVLIKVVSKYEVKKEIERVYDHNARIIFDKHCKEAI